MLYRRTLIAAAGLGVAQGLFAANLPGLSREWREKPVNMIIPLTPGGVADVLARAVGKRMGDQLDVAVIPNNKPGASGQLALEYLMRMPPDGHNLLQCSTGSLSMVPQIRKVNFDPFRSFTHLGGVAEWRPILTIRSSLNAKTFDDFVKLARTSPKPLTYGSPGLGSGSQLYTEMLKRELGLNMLHVPFKGSSEMIQALLGDTIDVIVDASIFPFVSDGRMQPLAAFGKEPHPLLPHVPPIQFFVKDMQLPEPVIYFFLAPAGLPEDIRQSFTSVLSDIVHDKRAAEAIENGFMIPRWISPQQVAQSIEANARAYKPLIPALGINQ